MFESVVDRFDSKYGITVLSTDPWVIIFDNFLTDSEVKALITTGDLFHLIQCVEVFFSIRRSN